MGVETTAMAVEVDAFLKLSLMVFLGTWVNMHSLYGRRGEKTRVQLIGSAQERGQCFPQRYFGHAFF